MVNNRTADTYNLIVIRLSGVGSTYITTSLQCALKERSSRNNNTRGKRKNNKNIILIIYNTGAPVPYNIVVVRFRRTQCPTSDIVYYTINNKAAPQNNAWYIVENVKFYAVAPSELWRIWTRQKSISVFTVKGTRVYQRWHIDEVYVENLKGKT